MNTFLKKIGYTEEINYRDKMLYIIVLCTIVVASLFLTIYFICVPFFPAIIVHIIYITLSTFMYIPLKLKKYTIVRYYLILAHIIQLTLAVYVWFPTDTGFGNYYFMVPMTSYLIMEYGDKKQRIFAIVSSLVAAALYLGSEITAMDRYLYKTPSNINLLFRTISILSILLPMTFIFMKFADALYKKQKELEFLANTDTLTQIKNRRSLYETGEEEFLVAGKYQFGFTVILLDIDFFKKINDTYGHPGGDEILIQFTEILARNIRKEDSCYRYGGEEFVVLLHRTKQEEGYVIADKLLELIRETDFTVDKNLISITASIGLVQYSNEFRDFDQMMKSVDHALYEAKKNGRNQIVAGRVEKED